MFWYDTRTPFKEILTSIICTNIVNDEIISNETMNNQIKPSSLKQKERRAEWKRCFEKVQNDPTGNHTQEELENSANHKKTLAQNKAQYLRKKRKAAINSRERQRQLINGREYAKKCRAKKKERETMDPYVIDNNPSVYNETLTSLSISTDRNAINNNPPVSSISSSDDKIEGSKNVEEESERLISTDSSNLTHPKSSTTTHQNVINNNPTVSTHPNVINKNPPVSSDPRSNESIKGNNVDNQNGNLTSTESSNFTRPNIDDNQEVNVNVAEPCSRVLLQLSCTSSPRKSNRNTNIDENIRDTSCTQQSTQFDYSTLNEDEQDLMVGIEDDLFLWNVRKESGLCTRLLNFALDNIRDNTTLVFKEATPIHLPEDIEGAFKKMLDQEINSENQYYSKVVDIIEQMSKVEGDNIFGQPYYYYRNRRIMRNGFNKSIYKEFLDPLKRFSIVKQSKRDNLFDSFTRDDNCLNGYVFEIVIAHYLQHKKIPCTSCKKKTLFWNGGSDHPWMDVICTSCNSTYEIKSKKDSETAESLVRQQKMDGGCFPSFFNLKRRFYNSKNTKQYLIVVGRKPDNDDGDNESFHKCIIAPIKDVRPIVNTKTFANMDNPKLKSRIITGRYSWFRIYDAKFSGPTSGLSWKKVASTYLNSHPDLE